MLETNNSERAELLGIYMINTGSTVRAIASCFGISKSTVHKDLTHKLPKCNKALYYEVKQILEHNKSERHIRGGEATKQKYLKIRDNK